VSAEPNPRRPAPQSTYRLQLNPRFGFDDVADIADYLATLGISHIYASPYLQAAPGSTHGYDVVDHSRPSTELGGEAGHERMGAALGRFGLGQILDIVPNHMAVGGRENAWWWDVLENGPASMYASYFDVDWDPPESKLRDTVLLPILGDHYGRVLEAGELSLSRDGGAFVISYHDHRAPVAPRTLDDLLRAAAERCDCAELESLATALGRLPASTLTDVENMRERHRDKEVLRARLADLCENDSEVAAAIDAQVQAVNDGVDHLDSLLVRQNYRLAYWRTAGRELDYRRFFDINTLVGLRVEDPRVFEDTHRLVLEWVAAGVVDGLRVDHPDGLRDPEAYLSRLSKASGQAWVVVEKILEPGEALPTTWPVAGTTGYDFLNRVGGLFVDPAGASPMLALYTEVTGHRGDWSEVVYEKKQQVLRQVLAADVNKLTAAFVRVCERHRRFRDYTRHELHEVVREVAACFPVYRSYVQPTTGAVTDSDVAVVEEAVTEAGKRRSDIEADLLGFFRDLLLLRTRTPSDTPGLPGPADAPEAELAARFQQLTGPAMAKGCEDTAFYTYVAFAALNEVGGNPSQFGVSTEDFHRACEASHRDWPTTMVTTATHDTKRGEDMRARLSLLSEIPEQWAATTRRWMAANNRHRRGVDRPDTNMEYLLYQTVVGAWPVTADRLAAYMGKASREAKVFTSWTEPDPDYDAALTGFVLAVMADEEFLADVSRFVDGLLIASRVTSLAQKLVALTAAGVPDVYQGSELWELSLVDPDNRRPVDYQRRRHLLAELEGLGNEEIWQRADEGVPKLLVVSRALQLRRRRPELFGAGGSYQALVVTGDRSDHAVAFARGGGAVTLVPRLVLGLGRQGDWGDTTVHLPPGDWYNELTGDEIAGGHQAVADVLARFPVALLSGPGRSGVS